MKKHIFISIVTLFLLPDTKAQKVSNWNIEKPTGTSKTININTDEGTWMNLDVSPDGKFIVFDLLGDIYKMPIAGGNAQLISGGLSWDVQPRFSPDGKYISFTSDKDGADNIWVMNADGTNKRAITKEDFRLLNNAVWTPDGQYIIARKHFTGYRSLGAGELWMYHTSGGFDGIQLTKRKNDQQDLGEPFVSPDGKSVYFSEDVSPGPYFQYNKNPNSEIYRIKKLNLSDNTIDDVAGGAGGAVRPQISKDGKFIAYVKRVDLKSQLMVQNLETGEEFTVYDDLSRDQQETWAIFGVYPNFSWLPDNENIVFYAKGKIRKVNIYTSNSDIIRFSVSTKQTIVDALQFENPVFKDEFEAKMIRQLVTSPDRKKVAFNAAGYIYIKNLPDEQPVRLTEGTDWEFEPSFSPDGNSIIFTTWNDELKGSISKIDLKTKIVTKLTNTPGFYYSPKFNNKGDLIVFTKGVGNNVLGFTYGKNPGIYTISANGGDIKLISKKGIKPQFNNSGNKIFFQTKIDNKKALKSIDLNGGNEKTHYLSDYVNDFLVSPDNKWLAFTELYNIYLTPFIENTSNVELSSKTTSFPIKRLSNDAGTYIHWNKDSKTVSWTLGPKLFSKDIKDVFSFSGGNEKEKSLSDTSGININLKLIADNPKGTIALQGARIITMNGDEVIEEGTILIERNKIVNLGKSSEIQVPSDAKIYPVHGKTIIPGLIDVHAHLNTSPDGISPQQDWGYFANLAYGVTTSHDPSSNTEMAFSQSEMLKAGLLVGPRVYSTGTILYGADGDFKAVINSLDDARAHLKRMQAVGAFSVKSYNQPRRDQRQQIIQAARELKMRVMPEGGSTFFTNMNMIADGHTGIEHNIPVVPVYRDVKQFWNNSKTAYTPTLIVSYGSQSGENYWYDRTNVWENQKLLAFTPSFIINERARRRTTSEYGDYGHIEVSRAVNQIADGGTKINLGSHGQLQGLGAHWELWMLAQGGMKPHDVLKVATINGATYLGMDKEIGSLEKGKLADLVVLNNNPLSDIRSSESIKYVMVNGRLYDAESMTELGEEVKPHNKFWWEFDKSENFLNTNHQSETFIYSSPQCD